jgi:hypothetical protein
MDPDMREHYEYLLNIKRSIVEELRERLEYLEAEYELLEITYNESTDNE